MSRRWDAKLGLHKLDLSSRQRLWTDGAQAHGYYDHSRVKDCAGYICKHSSLPQTPSVFVVSASH